MSHLKQLNGLSTVWIFFIGIQITGLRECLATLGAAKWFFISVDFFIGLQMACLLECLATLRTAKWFFNSVDFFMGLQIACLGECLTKLWTAKWFFKSMDFFMGLQIACLCECLAILLALSSQEATESHSDMANFCVPRFSAVLMGNKLPKMQVGVIPFLPSLT